MEQEGFLLFKLKQNAKENLGELKNFKDYTFIMPSVSVGNVGQLTVDILLTSLNIYKVGILHHPALLPLVGCDPYDTTSSEIITAADLHVCKSKKIVILQVRSPLIPSEKETFLKDLTSWIKNQSFRDVIILGSCHAHLRYDSQITGSQFRYVVSDNLHPDLRQLKEIGALELEEREDDFGIKRKKMPGAGYLYQFLEMCCIPAIGLVKFVDEGDNTRDALSLVNFLNSWRKLKEDQVWKYPFSWKNLFGAPPPKMMY